MVYLYRELAFKLVGLWRQLVRSASVKRAHKYLCRGRGKTSIPAFAGPKTVEPLGKAWVECFSLWLFHFPALRQTKPGRKPGTFSSMTSFLLISDASFIVPYGGKVPVISKSWAGGQPLRERAVFVLPNRSTTDVNFNASMKIATLYYALCCYLICNL